MNGFTDDEVHYFCPSCGEESWACGCPADTNTQDLMHCPSCGGKWWRAYGETSTACLHPNCGKDGSTVERAHLYAPETVESTPSAENA